jgi:ribosomal protein L18E
VHAISASAREKVERAGGTVALLREVQPRKPKKPAAKPAAPEPEAAPTTEEE